MAAPPSPSSPAPVPGLAATAQQILEAASRLFAARGFDGVSLQEVADAVGISKPSLLYHFPSKDDLRRRVLEKVLAHWNEALPQLLKAATSGEGRFDALLHEVVGFFTADPDRARLLLREVLDRPDEMGELLAVYVRPWVERLAGSIRKGQELGHIQPDADPEAYIAGVVGLVVSAVALAGATAPLSPAGLSPEDGLARRVAEVQRMARASLFRAAAPPAPSPPEAR